MRFRTPARAICFLLTAGVLLVADTVFVIAAGGGLNVGTLLPAAAGAVLILYVLFREPLNAGTRQGAARKIRLAFLLAVGLWGCSAVVIGGLIAHSAFPRDDARAHWIIVLGAGLRGDRPSLTLQARMETALAYLQRNPETKAVVSGGRGLEETTAEAEAMSRFFAEHGVTPQRIFKEEKSTSTVENLLFSKSILAANGADPGEIVGVVSSEFHIFRVKMLANRLGVNVQAVPARTPWYLLPNCLLREYFAIMKSFLLDAPSCFLKKQ